MSKQTELWIKFSLDREMLISRDMTISEDGRWQIEDNETDKIY